MNLRQYIVVFAFGTIVAFAAWFMVILNMDPVATKLGGMTIFLVTLFAAMVGFFTTFGTLIRGWRFKDRDVEDIVKTSLRQGFLLGILIVAALVLQKNSALTWWTMVLLIAGLSFAEFLSLAVKNRSSRTSEA